MRKIESSVRKLCQVQHNHIFLACLIEFGGDLSRRALDALRYAAWRAQEREIALADSWVKILVASDAAQARVRILPLKEMSATA
jgi:hypothetical protein